MGRFGSNFGDWRDDLTFRDRSTWPRKMCEAVDAGGDPETLMHECFANPAKYADGVITKFLPGEVKEFRAVTKLAPSKVDSELRQFEGWATKPELDRTDEIVDSKGVKYRNPTVLLLHHDHRLPIGHVSFVPKGEGIWFRAKLPVIEEPGELRDRVEGAWAAVKAGLLPAVSIGFRALEVERRPDGVLVYTKSELYELSLVTVPALASAEIDPSTIKGMHPKDRSVDSIPAGLTKQQQEDLLFAQARRILGKSAAQPVSQLAFHVAAAQLRHQQKTIAQAFLELEGRVKALEGK